MNNLENQSTTLEKSIFNLKEIDNVNKSELNINSGNNNEDNSGDNNEDNSGDNNEDNSGNNNEDNSGDNNEECDSDSNSEYGTTETSCSINSDDCLEYDSDISSNDSVFFYSESDDFVDNRFVRINHKPFLKLMKDKEDQIKDEDNNSAFQCPSSMSRLIDKSIFEEINQINEKLEKEYNKIKVILSDKKDNLEKSQKVSHLNNNSEEVVC